MFLLVSICCPLVANGQHEEPLPSPQSAPGSTSRANPSLFEVNARGFVPVAPPQAWQVLTDYEHLATFVPGMVYSKVLSRGEHEATIEQESKGNFLFVSHTVHMVLQVTELPFSDIDVKLISGDMKYYRAHWTLIPTKQDGRSGTLIAYAGEMEPAFFIPPLVGQHLIASAVQQTMDAVVAEIEKRNTREKSLSR